MTRQTARAKSLAMAANHHSGRRAAWRWPAWLLCTLALVSQLALGAVVVPDSLTANAADQLAALDAAIVDCAPGGLPSDTPALPHNHQDAALCPLSVALSLPSVILTPAPELPAPAALRVALGTVPPPARAPPSRLAEVHYPRGPPSLV